MDATTTPYIPLRPEILAADFPQFTFVIDEICRWSPATRTIFYTPLRDEESTHCLLHELAHGLLDHQAFKTDIELIKKEVEAWELVRTDLSKRYSLPLNNEAIEDTLDSYRGWLHRRSTCPQCSQNGLQIKTDTYSCINCRCQWRVNDARQCQLKRWKLIT